MKSALILAAALAMSAGCYKTTYLMSPNGGGNPSAEYSDHYHWSIINLIEISQPVNLTTACQGSQVTSIDESVTFLGGLINAVLGTYIPVLSVHNASVFCGAGGAPMGPAPMGPPPGGAPGGEPPPAQ